MTGLPDPGAAFCPDLVVPGEAEPVSLAAAGASWPVPVKWQRTAVLQLSRGERRPGRGQACWLAMPMYSPIRYSKSRPFSAASAPAPAARVRNPGSVSERPNSP